MGASYPRSCIMRTSAIVLLAVTFVNCDSDPYTIGQVAYGAGYGGVVTGIDYGHGLVAGYGALETGVSMGNVRLTATLTPLDRLQLVFQSTMLTPPDIPT